MNTRIILFIAFTTFIAVGCSHQHSVKKYGSVDEVMTNGQTKGRIALMDVSATPGAVGVGALAGLEGEVTFVDGEVWVARSSGNKIKVSGPESHPDDAATLLAVAYVDMWVTVPLGGSSESSIPDRIRASAAEAGVDTNKPFVFVIEGKVKELDAHVIAGSCPMANPDVESPARFSINRSANARLVGVYAEGSEGDLTHPGELTHMHVIMNRSGQMITGHVDHVIVGEDAILRVPAG